MHRLNLFQDPKQLLLALALLLLLGALAYQGAVERSQPWTALGPWAAPVSPTKTVISWQSDSPTTGTVHYGPADEYAAEGRLPYEAEAAEPQQLLHIELSDLSPGTRYAYQAESDEVESPVCYFSTPPEAFRPFTFLVYGDTRTHYDRHALVASRMAGEDAEFVVHVGDLIETPTSAEWRAFLGTGGPLFRSMSFLCVLGNHERNSRTYYDLFPLPQGGGRYGKQWWSLRWGDVLLVGLDSNLPYLKFTGLKKETAWLKEVLGEEARYKFVFFHHPLFSSDPHYGGDEGLAKLWHPIFIEAGVTAVFCGHCHNYEHIIRDGVHYVITGGGGAPFSPLSGDRTEGSVFGAENVLHYVRVEVGEEEVRVEMVPVAEVQDGEVVSLPGEPMEAFELYPAREPVGAQSE